MLRTELDAVPPATVARGTGIGFAAATRPLAAHTIRTDDAGLVAGEVTIDVGGFALPVYRAAPEAGGARPIVVVISEIFGVHEHIADVARRSGFHIYLQAQHAFDADYRPSYDRAAAEDGWQRCVGWLRGHGVA